ncbi:hypothetical protein PEC730217_28340 [Pectobacterium carotovorum subsp. carotovorum]|jgi:hypothetical protein|nr:hypothetical protein F018LOC_03167 [Pectobacterium versatile]RJL60355.1 hypothetical protein D5080_16090 [Pectobacterium versatile]RJL62382.1 hypothetical protein D5076_02985 [Pectobacterium versatile]GKW34054.1 hypothetical protein PEC730217_28340 [Pectobacterium carotovorum subsp. carotovorum]
MPDTGSPYSSNALKKLPEGNSGMINQIGTPYSTSTQAADTQRAAAQSATADSVPVNADSQTKQEVVFSSLAQQLSDSASRADAEYAGLSIK